MRLESKDLFMNKNNLSLIAFALLVAHATHGGVIVGLSLPEVVKAVVTKNQEQIVTVVDEFNAQNGTNYQFQVEQYSPHKSLSFVSVDQLSVDQAEAKFPGITATLEDVAAKHTALDLATSFKTLNTQVWENKTAWAYKFQDGKTRTNYHNVVLVAGEDDKLKALVKDVRDGLASFNIKDHNAFAGHLTLGKIYLADNAPVSQDAVDALVKYQAVVTALNNDTITINSFKLIGHDKSEKVFNLAQSKQ